MSDWMKSWGTFLTESKQPIEEASPQEIASLDKILLGLRYEDLSFNNIFGDRTRIAVPLGTEGIRTETEKFLNKAGYDVDMKTGIAAMLAATERTIASLDKEKVSFWWLITSDEEGEAEWGSKWIAEYLASKNVQLDMCLVGEPSASASESQPACINFELNFIFSPLIWRRSLTT